MSRYTQVRNEHRQVQKVRAWDSNGQNIKFIFSLILNLKQDLRLSGSTLCFIIKSPSPRVAPKLPYADSWIHPDSNSSCVGDMLDLVDT